MPQWQEISAPAAILPFERRKMEKRIEIGNEEEYQEFLRRLPKYRGLRYRATEFTARSKVHPKRVADIVTALNIKNRRKRIEYLFDRACDIIDAHNEAEGIICHYNADGICEDPKHQTRKNGCCCHCYLQSSSGCPSRNLSCKFYFCDHMCGKHRPLTMEDIDLLRLFTASQREIIKNNVFVTRKAYINMLWIGSYLIFCMYSVLKFYRIKNVF